MRSLCDKQNTDLSLPLSPPTPVRFWPITAQWEQLPFSSQHSFTYSNIQIAFWVTDKRSLLGDFNSLMKKTVHASVMTSQVYAKSQGTKEWAWRGSQSQYFGGEDRQEMIKPCVKGLRGCVCSKRSRILISIQHGLAEHPPGWAEYPLC